MYIQKYLQEYSLEELKIKHGVEAKVFGHKASFNYNQIEASSKDGLANQCRGLILSTPDGSPLSTEGIIGETIVLAYAMDRFFNYGEGAAAKINWKQARLLEKLDGTLIIVYFDKFQDRWCVATRSLPEATHPIENYPNYTFQSLFEEGIKDWNAFISQLEIGCTYWFELISPYNQVIVRYDDIKIYSLGKRDNTLCECDAKIIDGTYFPEEYNLDNIEDVIKFINARSPKDYEGLVALQKPKYNRVKIKSVTYVAAHRLLGKLQTEAYDKTYRAALSIILAEKVDDMISILPDEHIERIKKFQKQCAVASKYYTIKTREIKEAANKKGEEVGLAFEKYKFYADKISQIVREEDCWSAPLFAMLRKKQSWHGFIMDKQKNGRWPRKFLDTIMDDIERISRVGIVGLPTQDPKDDTEISSKS